MASNWGTIMELGITPIVTSGLIIQLLVGSKIVEVDNSFHEDHALLNGAQKLLGFLITLGDTIAYALCGMRGDITNLGAINAILIIFQLVLACIIVICLDELLNKEVMVKRNVSLQFLAVCKRNILSLVNSVCKCIIF
jgi:protein transport protein SEC61 subunit alpha